MLALFTSGNPFYSQSEDSNAITWAGVVKRNSLVPGRVFGSRLNSGARKYECRRRVSDSGEICRTEYLRFARKTDRRLVWCASECGPREDVESADSAAGTENHFAVFEDGPDASHASFRMATG